MNATAAIAEHRVLGVDDEPGIVDAVSIALRFQGFANAVGADRPRRDRGGPQRCATRSSTPRFTAAGAETAPPAAARASAPGGGARFEVALPARSADSRWII